MATVNKDFKIKSGLVVEGTTATVNGYDVLTKAVADENYIINLIGGTATAQNTPDTVVKRDGSGNFAAGTITADLVGDVTGNADTATTLETARTIELTGDVTGSVSFNGSQNVQIQATIDGSFATDTELSDAIAQEVTDRNSAISTAIEQEVTDRNNAIATALETATDYTDTAVSNLVDAAPEMLNTLNELAAAIADNPNYASDVTNLVATKADSTYVDNQDSYYDGLAQGYANTAEQNAKDYAENITNALTTDDVEEGNNLYFTDNRASNAAAVLLTNASTTNITITGDSVNGLVITAENGVADSTTDDLAEGSNLYFTDQRVLDAVENAVKIAPQAVDITWVRSEEATWTGVATASTATVHSFGTNKGSAKYLVRVINGSYSQVTEILATTDASNNVAVVEYGTIYTSETPLASATVVWNSVTSQYDLNVTTANNNSEVLVAATLLSYND
jgi:hypothetical protein